MSALPIGPPSRSWVRCQLPLQPALDRQKRRILCLPICYRTSVAALHSTPIHRDFLSNASTMTSVGSEFTLMRVQQNLHEPSMQRRLRFAETLSLTKGSTRPKPQRGVGFWHTNSHTSPNRRATLLCRGCNDS